LITDRAKDISLRSAQTGSGAHPASYTAGTGGKAAWLEAENSLLSSAQVDNGGAILVFRAQADWIMILPSASYCEVAASLADINSFARPVLLAHISYFFL
jgi:hypothetical protein